MSTHGATFSHSAHTSRIVPEHCHTMNPAHRVNSRHLASFERSTTTHVAQSSWERVSAGLLASCITTSSSACWGDRLPRKRFTLTSSHGVFRRVVEPCLLVGTQKTKRREIAPKLPFSWSISL